ncbi:MAG TPA: AraC family transcriptional regulator [Thermoanaerobaculia bacterium]|nr:AraC family transcriptional regulator [Thermoanaerobaculia bacterium]
MSAPHVVAEAAVRGIELRELVYDGGLIPRHAHTTAGFCLVLDGQYEERYAARTLACSARTVTFSPAGEEHANFFAAARSHCLTVDVPESWVERLEGNRSRLREPFETRGGTLASLTGRLLHELHGADDTTPLIIEGTVLELLGHAARSNAAAAHETQISPAIRRAYELLQASYREPVSLADLAAATNRHPAYIATAFREAYGETVGDCLRRLRVDDASRSLASTDLPIAEIALASGFGNQSHLTRAFKRATGFTPAAYRRRARR